MLDAIEVIRILFAATAASAYLHLDSRTFRAEDESCFRERLVVM